MAAPAPLQPPRDLTIPDEGSSTAREVLSRAIRRLLGELRALPRALAAYPPARREAEAFGAQLDRLLAEHPGAVASLLRKPTVGVLVRCLRREVGPEGDRVRALALFRELTAMVYLDLAVARALPGPVRLTHLPARLLSPAAGVAIEIPPGATGASFSPGRLEVSHPGGTAAWDLAALALGDEAPGASRVYHPIAGGIALALADNNPLAMVEAHPDKEGNTIDLGGHDLDAWLSVLRAAFDLIERHLPALRVEMDLHLHQVVPVGYHREKHLSASYQEALGTIYMTLHPSLMTMTEAIIHEFSHNKINALFELDPLLENAFWPLYASPVRPDPRPLHGVLLAVHAFQPVARLYERMIAAGVPEAARPDFTTRYARVRQLNHEGAEVVLAHGRPTVIGRGVLDEMRRWDVYYPL